MQISFCWFSFESNDDFPYFDFFFFGLCACVFLATSRLQEPYFAAGMQNALKLSGKNIRHVFVYSWLVAKDFSSLSILLATKDGMQNQTI